MGAVAIQQAMRYVFGLTYREIGVLTVVHPRTAWQHIAAKRGAKVKDWDRRTEQEQRQAIEDAIQLFDQKITGSRQWEQFTAKAVRHKVSLVGLNFVVQADRELHHLNHGMAGFK